MGVGHVGLVSDAYLAEVGSHILCSNVDSDRDQHYPGSIPLEIIAMQSAGYLGEDDLVRLEGAYSRSL